MVLVLRVAAILAWAVGCRRASCEPVISGGTGDQRSEVQAEISRFLDLLSPDLQVCVPEVEVVLDLEDTNGTYTNRSREIAVEPPFGALFHELCHAVQRQNELPVDAYLPVPGSAWAAFEGGDRARDPPG